MENKWETGLKTAIGIIRWGTERMRNKHPSCQKEIDSTSQDIIRKLKYWIEHPEKLEGAGSVGELWSNSVYRPGFAVAIHHMYWCQEEHAMSVGDMVYDKLPPVERAKVDLYVEILRLLNLAQKQAIAAFHRQQSPAPTAFCEARFLK